MFERKVACESMVKYLFDYGPKDTIRAPVQFSLKNE